MFACEKEPLDTGSLDGRWIPLEHLLSEYSHIEVSILNAGAFSKSSYRLSNTPSGERSSGQVHVMILNGKRKNRARSRFAKIYFDDYLTGKRLLGFR